MAFGRVFCVASPLAINIDRRRLTGNVRIPEGVPRLRAKRVPPLSNAQAVVNMEVMEISGNACGLAGRQGVYRARPREPNEYGPIRVKSKAVNGFPSSGPCSRFRRFAAVCRFCALDDTRNVTRDERLSQYPSSW